MRKSLALSVAALGALALFAGCAKKEEPAAAPAAQQAAKPAGGGELHIYIWSAYLPEEVLKKFTDRTGTKVSFDLYDSNEALIAKLQSGVADYDIVVPSDYAVRQMAAQKLIQEIDHARLPNLKNLDPRFLNQKFDPDNKVSIPYFWGTTGLGYAKKKFPTPPDSWNVVFDKAHKGRILMLDDMREVFGVALRTMGQSPNTVDPAILKQAAEKLKQQKKLVKTYDSGDFANILAAGDVDLAHGYNGQIAEVVQANPDKLGYVIPKEGATIWMDNMAIPSGARNLDNAYAFLNFVMEPEVNAEIVNGVHYASANVPARQFITPEILNDKAIYPSDEDIARCSFLEDIGEATTLLDQYWTEIKSQ